MKVKSVKEEFFTFDQKTVQTEDLNRMKMPDSVRCGGGTQAKRSAISA